MTDIYYGVSAGSFCDFLEDEPEMKAEINDKLDDFGLKLFDTGLISDAGYPSAICLSDYFYESNIDKYFTVWNMDSKTPSDSDAWIDFDLKDMKRNWWKRYRQAIKFVHEYIQEKFEWNGRVEDEQAAFPFLLSDYDENWNENIDKHLLQMIYYTPKHYTSFRDEL